MLSIMAMIFFWTWAGVYSSYFYDVKISQFVKLADDASTADKKLEYLLKYENAIRSFIWNNEARYVFKRERLTRDKQLEIIGTLVQRLTEAKTMNPVSFEYQTAMSQITGQEFNHTLADIDSIIHDCWLRQSAFAVFCLWFAWIPCLLGILIGVGLLIYE